MTTFHFPNIFKSIVSENCVNSPSSPLRLYFVFIFSLLLSSHLWPTPLWAEEETRIVIIGDSLTAGLGLPKEDAYPAIIERKLKSLGHSCTVVNAGISGDTSAGGLRRIDWLLKKPADIVVLALGANDGLRGIDTELTKNNLSNIIARIRKKSIDTKIILAGMLVPPNMGEDYANKFRAVFSEVAKENTVHLVPFLLDGVAAEPEMNQSDGIHPNVAGQRIIADNVLTVMEPLLDK
jgi:acyl-CoA thioesterase-1